MATLTRAYLRAHPGAQSFHSTRVFMHRNRQMANTNALLGSVRGVNGLKTGWTVASGYNLIVTAQRGGTRLIAVVMGGTSRNARDAMAERLIEAGFDGNGDPKKAIEVVRSDDAKALHGEAKAEMFLVYAGALADLKMWDKAIEIVHTLGRSKGLPGEYRMRAVQAEQYFLEEAGRSKEAEQLNDLLDRLEDQYADEEIDENSDDVVIDHDLEDITDDSDVLEKLGIDPDEAQYAPDPEQEYGDEDDEAEDGDAESDEADETETDSANDAEADDSAESADSDSTEPETETETEE